MNREELLVDVARRHALLLRKSKVLDRNSEEYKRISFLSVLLLMVGMTLLPEVFPYLDEDDGLGELSDV